MKNFNQSSIKEVIIEIHNQIEIINLSIKSINENIDAMKKRLDLIAKITDVNREDNPAVKEMLDDEYDKRYSYWGKK